MVNAAASDCLWADETTRNTGVYTNMYYLGIEPESQEFTIAMPGAQTINTIETMATRTATFSKGTAFGDTIGLTYIPVNSAPLFYMLGADSYADGVHTITAHATDAKPSRTLFRQGRATTEKAHATGCVTKQLQLIHSLSNGAALRCTESVSPLGWSDASSETPTVHSNSFPTAEVGAFDVQSTYTANSVAYTVQETSWSLAQNIISYGNNAGKRRAHDDSRPIIVTHVANVKGDITALRTLKNAGTGHTVVCKYIKSSGATKYLQFSCTMYIYDIQEKFRYDDPTDYTTVSWIGSNPTVTSLDGHTSAW